jgi:nucleoside-diphosphate-sugar epimerase
MKILLTGASSFTGYWFAKTLHSRGHEVVAPLLAPTDSYAGVRGERVQDLRRLGVTLLGGVPFGSPQFLTLVAKGADVLCHHAAFVENYKSLDFDLLSAVESNTCQANILFQRARKAGFKTVIHTGSVFEQGEGCGEEPLRAFSPYGLSKGLTHQILEFWADHSGVPLSKFVIPNPFGPYEEPRFCAYLMGCWSKGETATVKTPAYVRDNIHVSLLALAYTDFVEKKLNRPDPEKIGPSGYVESQGAFALRFANEIGKRLNIPTPVELLAQSDFSEPKVRINKDIPDIKTLGWEEEKAWDEVGEYYRQVH